MSDLESRLGDGLGGAAGRAPAPADLASGARARLRRRRRTTTAAAAAAVVVVVVPTWLVVAGGGSGDRSEGPTAAGTPSDWRTETWRNLSVDVPPDWGHGGGSDWCAHGRDLDEAVAVNRPGGVVPMIGCQPSYGYGVQFVEPSSGELPPGTEGAVQQYRGDRYPDGAWIGYAATQDAAVWVVTDDRTTTREVLDSATPVGEVDAHGCATRVEMLAPGSSSRVSVCRYDTNGWLEQSELLSSSQSRAALAAVDDAPDADGAPSPCPSSSLQQPLIVLQSADLDARLFLSGRCPLVATSSARGQRAATVTRDVLYWALSPGWSGGVLPRSGPLPEPLRTD